MEKHDLLHEFPLMKEKLHELKINNHHFKKLFDNYDEVNKEVQKIETGATSSSDDHLNELRKKRVLLKDEIYTYLKQ